MEIGLILGHGFSLHIGYCGKSIVKHPMVLRADSSCGGVEHQCNTTSMEWQMAMIDTNY